MESRRRTWRPIIWGSLGLIGLLLIGRSTLAQGVEAAPVPVDVSKAMEEIQAGTCDLDRCRLVIAYFQEQGMLLAADWWLRVAEKAVRGKQLDQQAKRVIEKARKDWSSALKQAAQEDLALLERMVQSIEGLLRVKDYEAARKLVVPIERLLSRHPDSRRQRILESCIKRLDTARKKGDDGAGPSESRRAGAEELIAAEAKLLQGRLAESFRQYELGGCRNGREDIASLLRSVHADPDDPAYFDEIRKLRQLAEKREPRHRLQVCIMGDTTAMMPFRDGAFFRLDDGSSNFSTETPTMVEVSVFPGDILRLVPLGGRESDQEARADGSALNSLLAVHASLDGEDLPAKQWYTIAKPDLEQRDPDPQGMLFAKKMRWKDASFAKPPPDTEATEYVLLFGHGTGEGFLVPLSERYAACERSFVEQKLSFTWVTGKARDAVYCVLIPE